MHKIYLSLVYLKQLCLLLLTMNIAYKISQQSFFMIAKQRQYKKFEQNLKQAITNVQKCYSAISQMKKDSASKTPQLKTRQIRRQKVQTYNTVEDQSSKNQNKPLKYGSQTTKEHKQQESQGKAKRGNKDRKIKQFNMQQSFSNKYNTVKKEYTDYSTLVGGQIALTQQEISLKQPKKSNELNKKLKQPIKERINTQKEVQQQKNTNLSGNGLLTLQNGWLYKGEYSEGVFDGYGQLYHNEELVYAGNFQYGYFQGYGKLKKHEVFEYLISSKELERKMKEKIKNQQQKEIEWTAYFGEFTKGNITGFGQLWLQTGEKIISKWLNGKMRGKFSSILDFNTQP